jgi:hypothetical protein
MTFTVVAQLRHPWRQHVEQPSIQLSGATLVIAKCVAAAAAAAAVAEMVIAQGWLQWTCVKSCLWCARQLPRDGIIMVLKEPIHAPDDNCTHAALSCCSPG